MSRPPGGIGFNTLALHAGHRLGSKATPPGDAPSAEWAAFAQIFPQPFDPAQALLEERVATLDGGSAAVAVASGSIARSLALETLLRPGDELVASGSDEAPADDGGFERCGWRVRWVDPHRPDRVADALSDRTRAILIGSIRPSDGRLADVAAIARIAQAARIPLLVDNTLATPYLMRPLEHGADIVLYAADGYLGGQDGLSGGFVVDGGTFDWMDDARYPTISQPGRRTSGAAIGDAFGNFAFAAACRLSGLEVLGTALAPSDPAAILHGIETLPLRMRCHCDNALAVARVLERHPAVHRVRYPGLQGDPDYDIASRLWPDGAGAICLFEIAGGAVATAFVARLKLVSDSAKIGTPRSTIARVATADQDRAAQFRLAVGLEDAADLIADLSQALAG